VKYSKYPSYKDSGVKLLEKIPDGWEAKKLKYSARIQGGRDQKEVIDDAGNYPVYGSGGVFGYANQYLYNGKSVLLGRKGTVDKPLYVEGKFWTVDTMYYTILEKTTVPKWLYYCASAIKFDYYQYGSAVPSMTQEDLHNIYFATPNLYEQQTIANYLDKATAKIDTLIEKQTKLIELLREKRQATVDSAIHHQDTLDMRMRRVVNQMRRPVNRVFNEEYEALGLYNRGRGLFHKPKKEGNELGDSDFYWVEQGDLIISGQFAWEGAVALASENENDCVVSHRYPLIRGKEELINTDYLWAYFTTREGDFILNEHSVGSAGRNRPLNMNTLLKESIPVPAIEEQLKVASIVKAEKEIKILIDREINLLKEKRTALISAAVTGKIDVRKIV